MVRVPEHNTSKLCPRCHYETKFLNARREIRTKHCAGSCEESNKRNKSFIYDRDTGASVNMFHIFASMVE